MVNPFKGVVQSFSLDLMQSSPRDPNISELVVKLDQFPIYWVVPSLLYRHKLLYKVYMFFFDLSKPYFLHIPSLSQIFVKGMNILWRYLMLQSIFLWLWEVFHLHLPSHSLKFTGLESKGLCDKETSYDSTKFLVVCHSFCLL